MEQGQEISFQEGRIKELENRVEGQKKVETCHSTQEDVLHKEETKPSYALIVTSDNMGKKEVERLIKKKVDPIQLRIRDATMQAGREGVILTTTSKETSTKLQEHIQGKVELKNLKIRTPKENRYHIKGLFTEAPGVLSYAAALRSGLPLGAGAAPGTTGGAAEEPARPVHEHVVFLTPTSQTDRPARDVVRLLKTNIDPAAKDIKDISLHYTRYGVTVFSNNKTSVTNMTRAIADNSVTRSALLVRVGEKRQPHVKFSGVDPDIAPQDFLARLSQRNPDLDLDLEKSKVRVTFRERAGTCAYIAEVNPAAFHKIMSRPRLSLGWTTVRASEDLHVPTCTFCASYGHGRSTCPVRDDSSKAVCMRCAGPHLGSACRVRMGDAEGGADSSAHQLWRIGAAPGTTGGAAEEPARPVHEHVVFLTPTSQTDRPARDVVRLLKTNIDPAAKDIKDISLHYTRYGVTVFSNNKTSVANMTRAIADNSVTRSGPAC
ncbi:hypothetical protein HPB49_014199 [Dermacentor silvarum]|uniref:Uncharacterized protein n=1 Tax=Dermacentor silvarum TaxID=543639 RepID=A0ACB8C435_DERSI|nr:hypothetical protein HPB49_014199 [Dermacentor silvarum]